MFAKLLQPPSTLFAVVLDVGDRSTEDNDYRLLGGHTDSRLAKTIAKSLNASIQSAWKTQRDYRGQMDEQERRDPDQFDGNFERLQKRLKRRIPNDYGAQITYDDVEHGARVHVQQLRVLKCTGGGRS